MTPARNQMVTHRRRRIWRWCSAARVGENGIDLLACSTDLGAYWGILKRMPRRWMRWGDQAGGGRGQGEALGRRHLMPTRRRRSAALRCPFFPLSLSLSRCSGLRRREKKSGQGWSETEGLSSGPRPMESMVGRPMESRLGWAVWVEIEWRSVSRILQDYFSLSLLICSLICGHAKIGWMEADESLVGLNWGNKFYKNYIYSL